MVLPNAAKLKVSKLKWPVAAIAKEHVMQKLSPQARQMLAKKLAMIQAARSAPAPSVPRPAMPPGAGGPPQVPPPGMKTGGAVKAFAKGGFVRAADGCAQRGKTRGKIV
jgi:hypothetical protein